MFVISRTSSTNGTINTSPISPLSNGSTGVGATLSTLTHSSSAIGVANTVVVPSYSGSTIVLPVPTGVGTVTLVQFPGYPPIGMSQLTQVGNQVAVTLLPGQAPPAGTTATVYGLLNSYPPQRKPTDQVLSALPDLFKQWNAQGSISFKRSFEGEPSASFTFTAMAGDEAAVRSAFKVLTPYVLRGIGFVVENLQINHLGTLNYPEGRIRVAVSFTGKHSKPLEEPVKVVPLTIQGSTRTRTITLSQIAQKAGTAYQGASLELTVPKDTAAQATTTLSQVLGDKCRLAEGFAYFSNPDAVEVRTFGKTRVHVLSDADVRSDSYTIGYPGRWHEFDGVPLTDIYQNAQLNRDMEQDGIWEMPAKVQLICKGSNPDNPPDVDDLRTPGMAFDNGGPTKEQTCTLFYNGCELQEITRKYGFVFCLDSVYNVGQYNGTYQAVYNPNTSLNLPFYWQKIEEVVTNYSYDSYGYLRQVKKSGWRLARLKQESGTESTDLRAQILQTTDTQQLAQLNAELDAYRVFQQVSLSDAGTDWDLADLANHYVDVPRNVNNDPSFIPALYCTQEETRDKGRKVVPDPAGTTDNPKPPIVIGKDFRQTKQTIITNTQPNREKFQVETATNNSEGSNLQKGLRISSTEDNAGRPSTQKRIPDYPPLPTTQPAPPKPIDLTGYELILNTQGNNYALTEPKRGSYSASTSDPDLARLAAEVDLAIKNSQKAEATSLRVRYNLNYEEGDMLYWKGKLWVIFGIDWSEVIQSSRLVTSDGMTLTIGRLLRCPVIMTKVRADTV